MIYSERIMNAIRFSIKTHEVYQKQKRKGKDIPYITHPLAVGLILARAGASEDVIIAGILHDTIEDSTQKKKVTKEMLVTRFGVKVAKLVSSVTEPNKKLSWEERKREALEHIGTFSRDSVMLKSGDVINNLGELLDDYAKEGEATWKRFNAPKDKLLANSLQVTVALRAKWPASPLAADLRVIEKRLEGIIA